MKDKVLRDHLIKLLKGGQAFVTFEQAIKDVKPELRNKRPSKDIHSVWENLEHMKLAQEDILKYSIDPKWESPDWPEGYWPKNSGIIDDKAWADSVASFLKDREEVEKLAMNEKIDLTSIIPHTEEHTYLREILLVADHNAYHLGQIVIARKLLNNWPV
jgi:uncharacterized damage-inducible protein DinB